MLLSFNSQQPPTRLHSRAQVHPHAQLPLPSDVSIVFNAGFKWLAPTPHKHSELRVFLSDLKTSDMFPPRWTFLTINLREVTGQRKELCTHAPLSLVFARMHRKQVVFTTGPLTHPQELLHLSVSEREREVEIGRSFVFNRKAIVVGFLIGFTSHLLVTQHFLLILCLQPLGLISFIVTARVE